MRPHSSAISSATRSSSCMSMFCLASFISLGATTTLATPVYVQSFGSCEGKMAVDSAGNVYVADGNGRILKYSTTGTYLAQIGSYGSGNGQLIQPQGVAVTSTGNIWVADAGHNSVQLFSSTGTVMGGYVGYNTPTSVAVDANDNVFIADSYHSIVQRRASTGGSVLNIGGYGNSNGKFQVPVDVAVDPSGNIYVLDVGRVRIQKFTNSGDYVSQFGSTGSGNGQFSGATSIAVDSLGRVYVADYSNKRIDIFATDGVYQSSFEPFRNGQPVPYPRAVTVDSRGNIYVATAGQIQRWFDVQNWTGGPNTFLSASLETGSVLGSSMTLASGMSLNVTNNVSVGAGSCLSLAGGNLVAGSLTVSGTFSSSSGSVITLPTTTILGGNLASAQGLSVAIGMSLSGYGQIDGPLTNHASIAGGSGSQSLVLTGAVAGEGVFSGNVTFSGLYSPGLPGIPTSIGLGTVRFSPSAELLMEIAGPGTQFDTLSFLSSSMDGTLTVQLLDGYVPAPCSIFHIFSGSITGSFSNLNLPSLPGGMTWDTSRLYADGILAAVPEPASLGLLVIGVIGLLTKRRTIRG